MVEYARLDVFGFLHLPDGTSFHITHDVVQWHAWLAQGQPFQFTGVTTEGVYATLFTVRLVTAPTGQWQAFTQWSGKRRERTLGSSVALTLSRLRDTALAFSLHATRSSTHTHAPGLRA